jgi:hypothetical protein
VIERTWGAQERVGREGWSPGAGARLGVVLVRSPAGPPGTAEPPDTVPAGPPGAAGPPAAGVIDRGVFIRAEPVASRCCSSTAATMITPRATACAELDRLLRVKTLPSVVKIRTPNTVPTIVPRPPMSSVPPMTTAAMASSS